MLIVPTALHGYAIQATDGRLGSVKDFLFDDRSWQCRWLVLDTGGWLTGRKVLVHPSALGSVDHDSRAFQVDLTRQQVADSPGIEEHQPVSPRLQASQYAYYGWDPFWGESMVGVVPGTGVAASAVGQGTDVVVPEDDLPRADESVDPNLRSIADVSAYQVQGTDGELGSIRNMLIDDLTFRIQFLVVATGGWWSGKSVLVPVLAVTGIDADVSMVSLDVTRDQVKSSPAWEPTDLIDDEMRHRLHRHYNWPGNRAGGLDSLDV